jgi:hypothetical protein
VPASPLPKFAGGFAVAAVVVACVAMTFQFSVLLDPRGMFRVLAVIALVLSIALSGVGGVLLMMRKRPGRVLVILGTLPLIYVAFGVDRRPIDVVTMIGIVVLSVVALVLALLPANAAVLPPKPPRPPFPPTMPPGFAPPGYQQPPPGYQQQQNPPW